MEIKKFKRGDFIVSGHGNIRIFTGKLIGGDVWECLAPYGGAPADTDMLYARHATEEEKKVFYDALEANGLKLNDRTLVITGTQKEDVVNAHVDWTAQEPGSYFASQYRRRVRPTVAQMKTLFEENKRQDKEIRGCLEREGLLLSKLKVTERSNELMEEELGRVRLRIKNLEKENMNLRSELSRIEKRGFWARMFNR